MKKTFIDFLDRNKDNSSFKITNAFKNCLNNKYYYAINEDLMKIEIIGGEILLKVLNKKFFISFINNLKEEYIDNKVLSNRTEAAAKKIHTHKVNVSHSYLLIRKLNNLNNISTILIDKNNIYSEFKNCKICLIIENFEVFCKIENISSKFNINFNETDIIYGSGKSINNQLNTKFLSKYDKLICFFDIDKSGFDMYISLKNSLEKYNTKVINLFVDDIDKYFKINNKFDTGFDNIIEFIRNKKNILDKQDMIVLDFIRKYEIGIEQEMFLTDIKEYNDK
jgi:hypothetical protein